MTIHLNQLERNIITARKGDEMAIIQPNKEIIQDINSSQNVESVEERLTRIGNEERQNYYHFGKKTEKW